MEMALINIFLFILYEYNENMLFLSFVTFITTLQIYDLTLLDMGFFVVIAQMIMKFGTDVRLDVF